MYRFRTKMNLKEKVEQFLQSIGLLKAVPVRLRAQDSEKWAKNVLGKNIKVQNGK